jgi:glycine reductase
MIPVAQEVGSLRTIASGGIVSPTGNPELPPDKEKAFRRELVLRALKALQEEVPMTKNKWIVLPHRQTD